MSVIYLEREELFPAALLKLKPVQVLLDIGCGIMPQNYVETKVHICCEPFQQYIDHLQKKIDADKSNKVFIIMNATWNEAIKLIPEKSIDSIFLIDVVEHLEKNEALYLIRESEKKVRKQIAIFTPLGFLPQNHPDGKDAWGLDGGSWQEHKSGWQSEDFDDSWEVLVAKVFHTTDNMGKPFETPYGALWAIKTFDNTNNVLPVEPRQNYSLSKASRRKQVHETVDKAIDFINKIRR